MKKLLSLLALLTLVFTVACSQTDDEAKDTNNDNNQEEKADNKDNEKAEMEALMAFELKMVDIMHKNGPALADLAASQADYADPAVPAEDKPTKEELEALKTEAQAASKEMATAFSGLTIPSELSEENQATLKTAVENFVKGMNWNAENIPALPAEAATEGDNAIAEFDKGINDLHTKVGLSPIEHFSNELY